MTMVKICGITRREEAVNAQRLGVWAIGEVFAPSRRRIQPEQAAAINRHLGDKVLKIGVFVNEPLDEVCAIVKNCGLDMVQLHGEESPEYLEELPVPAIKCFALRGSVQIDEVKRWRPWAFLFDAYNPALRGGSGQAFNWEWLQAISKSERCILAGGLNPENVASAIRQLRPLAVDVSSGVEAVGGGKDPHQMEQFMQRVKEADSDVSGC